MLVKGGGVVVLPFFAQVADAPEGLGHAGEVTCPGVEAEGLVVMATGFLRLAAVII